MRMFVHITLMLVYVMVASPARCQRYSPRVEGDAGISGYQIGQGKAGENLKVKALATVTSYIQERVRSAGFLTVSDPMTGRDRRLTFMKLERKVRREDDRYVVRGIFRDADNGEILGVDIYARPGSGKMQVIGLLIKKVGGRIRSEEETGRLNVDQNRG
jgi:hypothetical protein